VTIATTRAPTRAPSPEDATDDAPFGSVVSRGQRVIERVDGYQQSHRVLAIVVGVVKKFGDDRAGNLAALVSYYLFFSIFPLLLVFVTVVGFALAANPDLQDQLLNSALANFPAIGDQLRSSVGTSTGSGVALVVGLIGALWGGMGAIGAMQNTMNSIWNVPLRERPNLVQERIRSLIMLGLLAATVALSTAFGSVAGAAGSWPFIGRAVVLVPTLAINIALFWTSFKVLTKHASMWRALLPGAAAAGFVFTVLQTVGAVYVNHVVQGAGNVYGIFAVVLGLLSWLYLQAQLTVLCAEINVVRELHLYPRSLLGSPLTRGDKQALRAYALVEQRHPDEIIEVRIDPLQTNTDSTDDGAQPDVPGGPSEGRYPEELYDRPEVPMTIQESALDPDGGEIVTAAPPPIDETERSTSELVADVGTDIGELLSMHLDLAKTEIKEEIADAAKTAGVFGASAFAGYMTIVFLSFSVAWLLTVWLPIWAGFLIVTGLWTLGALALALNGRARSADLGAVPQQTVETVKEDVTWAQHPKT